MSAIGTCRACGEDIVTTFSDHVLERPACSAATFPVKGKWAAGDHYREFLERKAQLGADAGFAPRSTRSTKSSTVLISTALK